MKKILLRILSYVIDMFICTFLIVGLTSIPYINPNDSKVKVLYNELGTESKIYLEFVEKVEEFFDDGEIVEEEFELIKSKYNSYSVLFKDVDVREEVTNAKKDEIRGKIEGRYAEVMNNINYKIGRANVYYTSVSLIVFVLYFGLLQWIMKGQTIGKKILKLKVVDSTDKEKKVPLWKYFVRAVLVSELIFIGLDLIFVMTLKLNPYLIANYWISNVRYIYEMAFLIVMVMRDDQRSIHDLLINTRVMLMDKNKNEVVDVLFNEEEKEVIEVKEEKKTSKKNSDKKTTKKKTNEKEYVVAEKVNDKKKSNKTN